jgi:hypothetical protein
MPHPAGFLSTDQRFQSVVRGSLPGGPQAVSEENALQKFYLSLNE